MLVHIKESMKIYTTKSVPHFITSSCRSDFFFFKVVEMECVQLDTPYLELMTYSKHLQNGCLEFGAQTVTVS